MKLLNPDDYTPINSERIKEIRDEMCNVPNNGWKQIKWDIDTINNKELPLTLRTYMFNHLPYCVVNIILRGYK